MAYFRYFMTILAAFAAFFAYACRLNLSLTAVRMMSNQTDFSNCTRNNLDANTTATISSSSNNNNNSAIIDNRVDSVDERLLNAINCTRNDVSTKRFLRFETEEYTYDWLSRHGGPFSRGANSRSSGGRGKSGRELIRPSKSAQIIMAQNSQLLHTNHTRPLDDLIGPARSPASLLSANIDLNPKLMWPAGTGNNSSSSSSTNMSTSTASTVSPADAPSNGSHLSNANEEGVLVEKLEEPYLLDWTHSDKNRMLGAFFYGYVISQIPGARAAEIFGAKSLFLVTGLGASFCSLAFPIAAKTNYWLAYSVRVIMGITQGAMFPAIYVFLCQWLPDNERSSWLPIPSAFSRIGAIVMNFVIPFILDYYNWEMVFYSFGLATLVWSIVFIVFGSNSPQQSFWISKRELVYIESHMIDYQIKSSESLEKKQKNVALSASGFTINEDVDAIEKAGAGLRKPSISWLRLVKNKAILLLSLIMFSSEWSNYILLINLPGFLGADGPFNMDASEIGFWSSILIGIFCVQFPLSGICATQLAARTRLSSISVRKIFEAAAQVLQGVGCLMMAFYGGLEVTLAALVLMMLGRSTVGGGQCLMPPELSKDYPGTVFAFANTLANVAGVIGPEVFTAIVERPREHACWFWFWILSAGIFFGAGAVFCLLGDNKPQNYCRKQPKSSADNSLSFAQLTVGKSQAEEIFKMDTFSRVLSEPNSSRLGGAGNRASRRS